MAQIIDITGKITNELPVLKITDEIIATINNRKSVVLSIQAMAQEVERKSNKKGEDTFDQLAFMNKAMGMLVGEKNATAIDELDLPMPEYKEVYTTIMSIASGTYGEENTPK